MKPRYVLQPLLISTMLCATFSAAACTRNEPPAAAEVESAAVSDDRLETHVQARYQDDPQLRSNDIDVTVSDAVVTLRGTVPTSEARQHAVSVAQDVNGVRSVSDQLDVRQGTDATPSSAARADEQDAPPTRAANERTPGWITTKVQAQFFVNPEIKPWNIDVTTNSAGVVTLRGEVEEAADRDQAVRIARDTEGVTRVEDQLRVKGEARADAPARASADATGDAEDAWVTAKVQAKFFVDPDVKGLDIDVDTEKGVVTLRGQVASEAERRQAIAIARSTDGVLSVTDQLNVMRTAATAPSSQSGTTFDDAWITTKIQSQYFLDQLVKARNIDVDTSRGVVTLEGSVDSTAARDAALAIARDTEGVTRVVDRLNVTSSEPPRR
jgi:osmotically-inducible protein OsmY